MFDLSFRSIPPQRSRPYILLEKLDERRRWETWIANEDEFFVTAARTIREIRDSVAPNEYVIDELGIFREALDRLGNRRQ